MTPGVQFLPAPWLCKALGSAEHARRGSQKCWSGGSLQLASSWRGNSSPLAWGPSTPHLSVDAEGLGSQMDSFRAEPPGSSLQGWPPNIDGETEAQSRKGCHCTWRQGQNRDGIPAGLTLSSNGCQTLLQYLSPLSRGGAVPQWGMVRAKNDRAQPLLTS